MYRLGHIFGSYPAAEIRKIYNDNNLPNIPCNDDFVGHIVGKKTGMSLMTSIYK